MPTALRALTPRPDPLAVLFVALNAIDAATTAYLIGQGATEVNPVLAPLLGVGVGTFVTLKVTVSILLAALLVRFTPWALKALCVSFVGVVAWQVTLCVTY
ncbi:MAG TPA: DUF5658 family protein [Anaeromyxobacteraceae bacterium]|nr:DUF5658 family protein [Anaeromyxobacteraceae bacterium]